MTTRNALGEPDGAFEIAGGHAAASGMTVSNAAAIRNLNDAFRRSFLGGRVMVTTAVDSLDAVERFALLMAVRRFDSFDAGNDPHGEHDFGSIELNGTRFFWKIDCYDRACEYASPDAGDPAVTARVLTIMRADEY